jgi:hypothetical protein
MCEPTTNVARREVLMINRANRASVRDGVAQPRNRSSGELALSTSTGQTRVVPPVQPKSVRPKPVRRSVDSPRARRRESLPAPAAMVAHAGGHADEPATRRRQGTSA